MNKHNNFIPQDWRIFLHYIMDNHLYNEVPDSYIEQEDIRKVYVVIKDYYKDFKSIPDNFYIKETIDITDSLLNNIMKKDNLDLTLYSKKFDNYLNQKEKEIELYKKIEEYRNEINNVNITNDNNDNDNNDNNDNDENNLKDSIMIPQELYNDLPNFLKLSCNKLKDRERDVFLISELSILSSIFPEVYSTYFKKETYCNLYTFVAAPAASGKAISTYTKDTIIKIRQEEQNIFNIKKLEYEMVKDKKTIEYPIMKNIIIPGNSTHPSFVDQLNDNHGEGIMFETEADSMIKALKQDWGDYSTDMRKAFHHEEISLRRKTNKEYIQIFQPKLSISLTGTIGQIINMIGEKGTEDGLFSRFAYYLFDQESNWISPYEDSEDYSSFYKEEVANELKKYYDFYKGVRTKFIVPEEIYKKFDLIFKEELDNGIAFNDLGFKSTLIRLGVICHRIMMILSILRHYEEAPKLRLSHKDISIIECQEVDFNSAISIVNVFRKHTELLYNNLNKNNNINLKQDNKEKLFQQMPKTFKRNFITDIAKEKYSISQPTVDRMLKDLIKINKLEKLDRFTYQKK